MPIPTKLTLNSVVQRDPDVIAAEVDQEVVMVSLANGFYYGVSEVARGIWQAIERPTKISDLIADLTTTYSVERLKCEEETLLFLEDLMNEHLLQVKDAPFP